MAESNLITFPLLPPLPSAAVAEEYRSAVESFNRATEQLYEQLNGGISFGDGQTKDENGNPFLGHISGRLLLVVVPAADTDFPVPHGLGRIPLGFWEIDQTAEDRLFRVASTPAHTDKQLWVRSGAAAGTRYLVVVV